MSYGDHTNYSNEGQEMSNETDPLLHIEFPRATLILRQNSNVEISGIISPRELSTAHTMVDVYYWSRQEKASRGEGGGLTAKILETPSE